MLSKPIAGAILATLPACPALADEKPTPNFLPLPGSDTKLRVYGTVWVNSWYYFNQNLKDTGALVAGEADPLNAGSSPDRQWGMTAKNSRFGFTTTTPSALGEITTQIEMDFARDQAKNGGASLRHAWVALGGWTAGYTWSNWLDLEATGETVDMNGPVGQACNGSSRHTQLRYTWKAGERSRLAFALEQNPMAWKFKDIVPAPDPKGPTVPDARYPTLVAAYTFSDRWGHVAVRAMEQNYGAYTPAAGPLPEARPSRWGGAVQLSGAFKFGRDLLAASVYTGSGLGDYGAGIQGARIDPAGRQLLLYRNLGWQAGYTHAWTGRVRSNLVLGGVAFNDDAAAAPASIRTAASAFLNTFVKLNRTIELGVEYGFENLQTFGAGQVLDREGARSGQNRSNKVQVSLTANF